MEIVYTKLKHLNFREILANYAPMNQMFLSAIFLQKALTYNPREIIFRPEVRTEQTLRNFVNWKKQKNFAEKTLKERNRDFFRHLAKPKSSINSSSIKDVSKISRNFNPKFAKRGTQKTTLIIAPHPDDEILGTANLITEKLKSREKIKIIYLTNGDALGDVSPQEAEFYGKRRILESQEATRKLGLRNFDLYFLGFPDGLSDKLPAKESLQSPFTKRTKTYRTSYFPNIKYSRDSLQRALRRLIERIQPDEIYYTGPYDNNVDHAIIQELLPETSAKKFTFNIHRTFCENEICQCDQPVDSQKLELIKIFQSQRFTPHHEEFLDQFACQKEVFREVE